MTTADIQIVYTSHGHPPPLNPGSCSLFLIEMPMSVQAQKYVPISSKIYRRKVIAVTLTTSLTTTAVTSECQNFDSDSPIFLLFDFDSFMNGIFLQLWTLPPDTYTYSQKCTPLRVCYFPTTHIYKRSISTYLDPIYKQNCFPTGSLLP